MAMHDVHDIHDMMHKGYTDLAKVHRLDTLATKSRANWRAGTGLAGAHNQLNDCIDSARGALCCF